MQPTDMSIAERFSRHDFTATYPHLAPHVRWHNVGGDEHVGRDAVIAACDAATSYFASIDATVTLTRTIPVSDTVIIEAVGTYVEDGMTTRVASCDIYEFEDSSLTAVTSYNVELEP
jgi:SnoaL-like domain